MCVSIKIAELGILFDKLYFHYSPVSCYSSPHPLCSASGFHCFSNHVRKTRIFTESTIRNALKSFVLIHAYSSHQHQWKAVANLHTCCNSFLLHPSLTHSLVLHWFRFISKHSHSQQNIWQTFCGKFQTIRTWNCKLERESESAGKR